MPAPAAITIAASSSDGYTPESVYESLQRDVIDMISEQLLPCWRSNMSDCDKMNPDAKHEAISIRMYDLSHGDDIAGDAYSMFLNENIDSYISKSSDIGPSMG